MRKTGAAIGHVTVEAFTEEKRGNAQAGFFELVALQGVVGDGALPGIHMIFEFENFLEEFIGGFVGELSGSVEETGIFMAAAGDLRDFFFESHAGKKIGDAIVDGEFGIFIGGDGCCAESGSKRAAKQKMTDRAVRMEGCLTVSR